MLDQKGGGVEGGFDLFEVFRGVAFGADEVVSAFFDDDS